MTTRRAERARRTVFEPLPPRAHAQGAAWEGSIFVIWVSTPPCPYDVDYVKRTEQINGCGKGGDRRVLIFLDCSALYS